MLLIFTAPDIVKAVRSRYLNEPRVTVQFHKDLADLFSLMEGKIICNFVLFCYHLFVCFAAFSF